MKFSPDYVASVLNDIGGNHADARGLRQRGDQKGINLQSALVYGHVPPRIAPERGGRLGETLRELHRCFIPLRGKRAYIASVVVERGDGNIAAIHIAIAWSQVAQ